MPLTAWAQAPQPLSGDYRPMETPATVEKIEVIFESYNGDSSNPRFEYKAEVTFSRNVTLNNTNLKLVTRESSASEETLVPPDDFEPKAERLAGSDNTYIANLTLSGSDDTYTADFALKKLSVAKFILIVDENIVEGGNLGRTRLFTIDRDRQGEGGNRPAPDPGDPGNILTAKIDIDASDGPLSEAKDVTVTFSEAVTGFEESELKSSPEGLLSGFSGNGTTYTATLTPPDNSKGEITLSVESNAAKPTRLSFIEDEVGVGIGNGRVTRQVSYNTTDPTAPTVTITTDDDDLREGETTTVTVTFSEAVTGFEDGELEESAGTLGTLSALSGSDGKVYTATLTPPENSRGTIKLNVAAGVAKDSDDNDNSAAAEVEIKYNTTGYDPQEAFEQVSEAVLPGVLHNKMGHHVEALRSRVETISSPDRDDSQISMELKEMANSIATTVFDYGDALASGTVDWQQALAGRSFSFPAAATSNSTVSKSLGEMDAHASHLFSTLAFWGSTDYSSFSREVDRNGLQADADGHSFTVHLGADVQPNPELLTGLALAFSRSQIDWDSKDDVDGTYTATFTTLHPYVSWFAGDWQVWTSALFGTGYTEWDTEEYEAVGETSNIFGLAGGARLHFWSSAAEEYPLNLSLKLDGATASFQDIDARQARLSIEAARQFPVQSGALGGALSLGLLIKDDSTYGTSSTAEVGANTTWHGERITLNGRGRYLFAASDQEDPEWGIGGSLIYKASSDGEGMMASLQPSIGVTNSRMAELWSLTGSELVLGEQREVEPHLRAELAYGLRRGAALLTPYTDLSVTPSSNIYGIGVRYDLTRAVSLDLHGSHRAKVRGENDNSLMVDFTTQF